VSPPRFFIDSALAPGATVRLPDDVAHHALHVLRLRDGAPIVVYDGRGGQYPATLLCEGATARARLGSFDPLERESPLKLTLIQTLVAAEKIDWIVEKAVELGVERIVIVPMQRSVVRLVAPRAARRLHHWTDIARAASSQCGRNRVPSVDLLGDLGGALAAVPAEHDRMLLAPGAGRSLCSAWGQTCAALVVGPEGGLAEAEIALAGRAGFVPVSLGPRVLRTETAGLAAIAALQATRGDFAGSPGQE
jgi:16S rRNA (uracil1498-N3)-methyltransferase